MALHLRKRGKTWHARGTIKIGRETVTLREISTGANTRADAEAWIAHETARIREAHLAGPAGRARALTVAECILAYLTRPEPIHALDRPRLRALSDRIGEHQLEHLAEAWREWQAAHPAHSPGTATRYRALLLAAIRHACAAAELPAPGLPAIGARREDRLVLLTEPERAALLRSYNAHAACPVLLMAYAGLRTQEALQLDWREVDFATETMRIGAARAKSGRARAVPMHPRVLMLLWGMWHAAGKPHRGAVFLSSRGAPYADTVEIGGNPLSRAHATACRAAGIKGFRPHDWRHDWAARMVMAGVDLYTLMRIGGWQSLAMVERYAAVSAEHLRAAIRRIA